MEIHRIEKTYLRKDIPDFAPGDMVKVYITMREDAEKDKKKRTKTRLQVFEGVVLRRKGSGLSQSFTVRKVTQGIGIERVFPLHSPIIEKIEVKRRGKVRRARLYYLRDRKGKKARIKEKR